MMSPEQLAMATKPTTYDPTNVVRACNDLIEKSNIDVQTRRDAQALANRAMLLVNVRSMSELAERLKFYFTQPQLVANIGTFITYDNLLAWSEHLSLTDHVRAMLIANNVEPTQLQIEAVIAACAFALIVEACSKFRESTSDVYLTMALQEAKRFLSFQARMQI